MNILWKTYYRLVMGKTEFDKWVKSAKLLNMNLKQSSKGSLQHFYDVEGNQIRGWHKRRPQFKEHTDQHPLISKYN